jgi:hypothetical protein
VRGTTAVLRQCCVAFAVTRQRCGQSLTAREWSCRWAKDDAAAVEIRSARLAVISAASASSSFELQFQQVEEVATALAGRAEALALQLGDQQFEARSAISIQATSAAIAFFS